MYMKMTYFKWLLLLLVAMATLPVSAVQIGTEVNPFTIESVGDIMQFRDAINDDTKTYKGSTLANGGKDLYFKLTADLDLSSECYKVDGTIDNDKSWTPIGNIEKPFQGHFDGGKHTISNLYINTDNNGQGLFGYIDGSEIKNINLKDVDITGTNSVGGLVGYNEGTIQHVAVSGMVSGSSADIGGIVGFNVGGTIEYCVNLSTLTTKTYYVGGIAGESARATIRYCANAGTLNGNNKVGGIVGETNGTLESCSNYGVVYGSIESSGGIVGTAINGYSGSYYDKQMCTLNGGPGKLTTELIEGNLFNDAEHWSEAAGRYPIPKGLENNDIALVAAKAIVLHADNTTKYETRNKIVSNFTVGTMNEVAWESSSDVLAVSGANVTLQAPGKASLTASKNGYSKTIALTVPNSEELPYEISSVSELAEFRDAINDDTKTYKGITLTDGGKDLYFKLTADLDLADVCSATNGSWTPIGLGIKPFQGHFDGGGHTISNLYINTDNNIQGLFGYTKGSKIKNINIKDIDINGGHYVGGLVGMNRGTIRYVAVSGNVSGQEETGGIAGANDDGVIEYCVNLSTQNNYSIGVGGIAGYNSNDAIISYCANAGKLNGTDIVGGIVGYNDGALESCSNYVAVFGSGKWIGGIAGANSDVSIGSYYDKQMCAIGGIDNADTEDKALGKLTTELIEGNLFNDAEHWSEAAGRYPIPKGLENNDIALVAAKAIVLNNADDNISSVTDDFKVNIGDGVAWSASPAENVTISGAEVAIVKNGKVTLTVSKNGISKEIVLTLNKKPTVADIAAPAAVLNGENVELIAPVVTNYDETILYTYPHFEIESEIAGFFVEFAAPFTVTLAGNGRKIRYAIYYGLITIYSNEVALTVNDPSGVDEIDGDEVRVYVQNRAIVIENAAEGSIATVTSLSGATVARTTIETTARIEVPAAGLYIVKVGNKVKKVMVK